LSDLEAQIGDALFDALISLDPELPNKAMGIESYPSFHRGPPVAVKSRRIRFRGRMFEVDVEIAHAMAKSGIQFTYIRSAVGPNEVPLDSHSP
jgi:hypothetical protein